MTTTPKSPVAEYQVTYGYAVFRPSMVFTIETVEPTWRERIIFLMWAAVRWVIYLALVVISAILALLITKDAQQAGLLAFMLSFIFITLVRR